MKINQVTRYEYAGRLFLHCVTAWETDFKMKIVSAAEKIPRSKIREMQNSLIVVRVIETMS